MKIMRSDKYKEAQEPHRKTGLIHQGAMAPSRAPLAPLGGRVHRKGDSIRPINSPNLLEAFKFLKISDSMLPNSGTMAPNAELMVPNDDLMSPNDLSMFPNGNSMTPDRFQMCQNDSPIDVNDNSMSPNAVRMSPNEFSMVPNELPMTPNKHQTAPNEVSILSTERRTRSNRHPIERIGGHSFGILRQACSTDKP